MVREISSTLLSDGSSDAALIQIVQWTLDRHSGNATVQPPKHAKLGMLRKPPRSLAHRIEAAIQYYPCDILFVHRDAEKSTQKKRLQEIAHAANANLLSSPQFEFVGVVPVRMTEAWLLGHLGAIRKAAGNPHGSMGLDVPALSQLEWVPDPKQLLHAALRKASGLTGRRLKRFKPGKASHRICDHINSFEHLLRLPAFRRFYDDTGRVCSRIGKHNSGEEMRDVRKPGPKSYRP